MPNIRSIDMLVIDDLFQMGDGYVLNFSDRTFAQFFAEELNVDIDNPAYAKYGTSKARRLRCFLQTVDKATAVRALSALWDYREVIRERVGHEDPITNAHGRLLTIINRLNSGTTTPPQAGASPVPAFDRELYPQFLAELQDLIGLEPHARGYAFESFLKRLFDRFGLEARDPFRLIGEQIDGSFLLGSETYLLEGKWQNAPSGIDHLHTFHGKVEQKAAWTRGLFISYTGFSEDGLTAFGRGKRVICMDGSDLSETFIREVPLNQVLERKVRRAAETGLAFVRVRDLF
ncbi:MAG: restriction endonuclease [Stellaceae bacterium]